MDKLRALEYFVAAAREGSMAGAARRLEVSVPSVHKMLSALEARLGVRLFERSARGLSLTAVGDTYLETSARLLDELAALDEGVSRSASRPSGTLVVGAHPQLVHHFLLPELPRFHARYPEIHIDLRVVHRLSDADAAAADVFLLHGWPEAPDMVHKRLGLANGLIAASPEYWKAHGIPRKPADLAQYHCLLMRNPAGILIDLWEFERGRDRVSVQVAGWFSSNNREVILDAILAGEGVGRLNVLTTRELVHSGRLVPVLQDWQVMGGPPLNLLFRANQRGTPRLRLFIDYLGARVQEAESDILQAGKGAAVELPHWYRPGYGRASAVLRRR